jgi:predicted kinase
MTTLIITRGYPASGKTTYARLWVERQVTTYDVEGPRARVNRDDIRAMVGITSGIGSWDQEQMVTTMQRAQVRALLKDGVSVIIDDTNLRLRHARGWADLAAEQGAAFVVFPRTTPWFFGGARAAARGFEGHRFVGKDVIKMMAEKFPISQWKPILPHEKTAKAWEPVEFERGLPEAWLVDLDGTLAKKDLAPGSRGWHEYDRVGEDLPNPGPIRLLQDLHRAGHEIIFMSGRKEHCRPQTRAWLDTHVGLWAGWERPGGTSPLFMRADEDNRSDDLVKYDLFNTHIRGKRNILGVLDDRDRVVAMWRALGLFVAQVDYGDF